MDSRDLFPEPAELADDEDQLDWDRTRDGRMVDYATADHAVETVSFEEG